MAKRMILMLGVTLVLLTALGFVKFKQVQSAVHAAAFQPPPEAVTSIVAQREQWPATMNVIGTMEAVHGVTVSADLPGPSSESLSTRASRCTKGTCSSSSIRGRSGPNWRRSRRSAIWRASTTAACSNW